MRFKNLDTVNQTILTLLSENSRMSFVDIAKKVGLSRVAVKSRIEHMEESGIIERFSIVINPEKVGRAISVYLDIEVEPKHLFNFADELKKCEYITDIYLMTGSSNLHVHATLDSNNDLEKFLKEKIYVISGIIKVNCNTILSRIKVRKGIRL